jgi:hypothetical protein
VGRQKRYGREIDGYRIPVGARRHDLDVAVQRIVDHVTESGRAGIYTGDGGWRGSMTDPLLAPMLEGPDRVRRGDRVDGKDTLLAAAPGEEFADIQDRLYRCRHYASPRMVTRAVIADAFYAGIGIGVLRPVPRMRGGAARRPGARAAGYRGVVQECAGIPRPRTSPVARPARW